VILILLVFVVGFILTIIVKINLERKRCHTKEVSQKRACLVHIKVKLPVAYHENIHNPRDGNP
jgi:hypothetical protein